MSDKAIHVLMYGESTKGRWGVIPPGPTHHNDGTPILILDVEGSLSARWERLIDETVERLSR